MSYKMGSEYTSNLSKAIDEVQHKPDVFFFILPIGNKKYVSNTVP